MKTRIITGVIGVPVLILALCFYYTPVFNVIVSAICVVAFYEIINAFKIEKPALLYVGLIPMMLLIMLPTGEQMQAFLPYAAFAFIVYMASVVVFKAADISFLKLSGVIVFCSVVLFGFYSVISFKTIFPKSQYHFDAVFALLLGFCFAWGGDTMAYFVGCKFGKHKLAPTVSPNKTIEGAVGGIAGSIILGCIAALVYSNILQGIEPAGVSVITANSYIYIAIIGAVASMLGIMGDLFTSSVKRQCDIKDYGTIFPGHGGILDRFDSVLLVMPFVALSATLLK